MIELRPLRDSLAATLEVASREAAAAGWQLDWELSDAQLRVRSGERDVSFSRKGDEALWHGATDQIMSGALADPAQLGIMEMLSVLSGDEVDALILPPAGDAAASGPIDAIRLVETAPRTVRGAGDLRWRQETALVPHTRFWLTRVAMRVMGGARDCLDRIAASARIWSPPGWARLNDTAALHEMLRELSPGLTFAQTVVLRTSIEGDRLTAWIANSRGAQVGNMLDAAASVILPNSDVSARRSRVDHRLIAAGLAMNP